MAGQARFVATNIEIKAGQVSFQISLEANAKEFKTELNRDFNHRFIGQKS